MPTLTPNFSLNKPLVNDPIDEDLWGGQLNTNADTIDARLTPTGVVMAWPALTVPNSSWLLCDGAAVSRATYSDLFALVGTSFGSGDGATTFNVPDGADRVLVGIGSIAGSIGNTGGSQTQVPSGSISGSTGSTSLSISQMPAHTHDISVSDSQSTGRVELAGGSPESTQTTGSTGGGGSHNHSLSASFSGNSMSIIQPYIGFNYIIKT